MAEEPIKLTSCTHLTKAESHPGYVRLGRTKAPDPSRTTLIPLASGQNMIVEGISWDEQSGRICIQASCAEDRQKKFLGIVDLL